MNNNFEFNDFLAEDIIWTLKNFSEKFKTWENMNWKSRIESKKDDPYVIAARAVLIVAKKGYGECFMIDDFIRNVESGLFINSDGHGDWVDWYGNKIGSIQCDTNWLKNNKPEKANFIMWYNK